MATLRHTPAALAGWVRLAGWTVAVAYVVGVGLLGATSFWSPNEQVFWPEIAAFALTLPASIAGIVPFYLGGALLWNLTGADSGGPMWPVTLGYGLMFAGLAAGNVWLVRQLGRHLRGRRHRASVPRTPAPHPT